MALSRFSELKKTSFWLAVLAEFLGSFLLVVFGCGSCGTGSTRTSIALGFGSSVASVVWVIGHVSGGHINPAITVSFLITRKFNLIKAIFYIISQCSGATLGALILQLTLINNVLNSNLCTPKPSEELNEFSGFIVESLITFLLVFVVFASCDPQRKGVSGAGPLAIGLSVVVGHLWAVNLTGAGTNPARSFGPAIVTNEFQSHWIYWVGPLLGGPSAAVIYDLLFAVNACRDKAKAFFTSKSYDDADYSTDGANIINLNSDIPDIKSASV